MIFDLADEPDAIVLSTETAEDVIIAALRKIVGIAELPDRDQSIFALEMLENMLREWRGRGADLGITFPLELSTVLAVQDSFIPAIKANLTLALCDDFQREITPSLQRRATMGLVHVLQAFAPEYTNEQF